MRRGVLVVRRRSSSASCGPPRWRTCRDFDSTRRPNGIQAIEVAEREQPTIVFLDVDKPRMMHPPPAGRGGQSLTSAATIVILNATTAAASSRGGGRGADLSSPKPFSPLELLRLVDRLGGEN